MHSKRLSLRLMAAMKIQVDIFLLFSLIITKKDKVLPTNPNGSYTGNQYLAIYLVTLKVM